MWMITGRFQSLDPRCKTNIDECESSPCLYNGTCVDGIARYECVCIPGITGPNCETDINECESDPCKNGGSCIDHINGYVWMSRNIEKPSYFC